MSRRAATRLEWLVRAIGIATASGLLLFVLAWLVGRLASDRWVWSQFLAWIPTPFALLATAMGSAVFIAMLHRGRARKRATLACTALLATMLGWFGFVEHRFFHGSGSDGDLRIVHWAMSRDEQSTDDEHVKVILHQGADISLLHEPGGVARSPTILAMSGGNPPVSVGSFAIVTPLPVIEARELFKADSVFIGLVEIDTRAKIGRSLRILLIDWPSQLKRSRFEHARVVRDFLDQPDAPAFDLVLGDFNATRGSASIAHAFPDLREAFDEAGVGYAASFHRSLPLFHIDHVLLSRVWRATRYQLVDPGFGRHLMQVVDLQSLD